MVRINKIYTKIGDGGETNLVGGSRIAKDSVRVRAYGEVDELNAFLGMARTIATGKSEALSKRLAYLQNQLFDLGAELSTPPGADHASIPKVSGAQIEELETWIDELTDELEELKSFVLPGGTQLNATLHQCRTICRRAERNIIALSREEELSPLVIKYVNRLSDLFFAMARYDSFINDKAEYLWEPAAAKPQN